MTNIRQTILLILAGGILCPFIDLPSHRWAKQLYYQIKRDILAFPDKPKKITEEQIRNSLYNLKSRQYIKRVWVKKQGKITGFRLELTKKGKTLLKKRALKDLYIPKPPKWDGKWRFIIFDVPEKYRHLRWSLRDTLRKLGFFRVQDSVWVYPYPCEKEIEVICEFLDSQEYVLVFESEIKRDFKLKEYFRKRGFAL